jgi:hypothetical protein
MPPGDGSHGAKPPSGDGKSDEARQDPAGRRISEGHRVGESRLRVVMSASHTQRQTPTFVAGLRFPLPGKTPLHPGEVLALSPSYV